jgi:uncharacterized protein
VTYFIYILHAVRAGLLTEGPTPSESEVVERHFAYLRDLTARGVALLVGRTMTTDQRTFGIALLRVESEAEAERMMLGDPAVAEGVMTAELFPFRVALALPQAIEVG